MKEAATVAHIFPAFGDPLDLPIDVFYGLRSRVGAVVRITSGEPMSDRELVEDMTVELE